MDKRINTCHICSYYNNILFDNLVSAQMEYSNPKVFFFKKYGTGNQYNLEYVDEVECYYNIDRIFFFLKAYKVFKKFKQIYHNMKFDLFFAHSLFANGYIAYLAKKKYNTPYIVMVQNTDINVFYKMKPYLSRLGMKILNNASAVIFASPVYRDYLISKHVPEKYRKSIYDKSKVIPYGIEDIFFEKSTDENKEIKEKIHIICAGLICKNKNQVNLAKAIEELNKAGYSIELSVVGKIDNRKIESRLKKYDFVSMIPYMDKNNLIREYRKADFFVLTSHTETFGLVYAEALSQGLPIVYSSGQGFDGQFEEGLVGYSANSKSVESIKKSIIKVIDNYDELKKMTKSAALKFQWEPISNQYKELYDAVLSKENG